MAMAYLDDIIVFASTVSDMVDRLKIIFGRLRSAGLKLKAKKCELFQLKTIFLGHVISADGVECDPAKVEAVKAWKPPHNVRFVRSFLGTVGYYRRFIKSFAEIAKPLFDLLKKNRRFVWTDACQRAFRTL